MRFGQNAGLPRHQKLDATALLEKLAAPMLLHLAEQQR